jgi:hypothetical protein
LAGDLNYRLDLTYERALELIQAGELSALLEHDQLGKARLTNREVADLEEAPIGFPPTYKYDTGTDNYDTSPKQRTPSYTDRVLVKTSPGRLAVGKVAGFVFETDLIRFIVKEHPAYCTENCFAMEDCPPTYPAKPKVVQYATLDSKFSDHRPLACILNIGAPVEVPEKMAKFDTFMNRKLDELSALAKPLAVVPQSVTVSVGKPATLPITNVSIVWARWRVIFIGNGVKVLPGLGVLFPGQTANVEVSAEKGKGGKPVAKADVTVLFMDDLTSVTLGSVTVVVK